MLEKTYKVTRGNTRYVQMYKDSMKNNNSKKLQ